MLYSLTDWKKAIKTEPMENSDKVKYDKRLGTTHIKERLKQIREQSYNLREQGKTEDIQNIWFRQMDWDLI